MWTFIGKRVVKTVVEEGHECIVRYSWRFEKVLGKGADGHYTAQLRYLLV